MSVERKTCVSVSRSFGGPVIRGRKSEAGGWKSAGFSLVEVTVAIGIFAFVVVGVLGLLPTALRMRAESAQETRAVMIATGAFFQLCRPQVVQRAVFYGMAPAWSGE